MSNDQSRPGRWAAAALLGAVATLVQTMPALGQAPVGRGATMVYLRSAAPVVSNMAAARQRPGRRPRSAHLPLGRAGWSPGGTRARTQGVIAIPSASGVRPYRVIGPNNATLVLQASTPLTSRNQQMHALGGDQAVEPPDPQLAVGPYNLVELTNSSATIWSKGINQAIGSAVVEDQMDLNVFFGVANPYTISDPRLQYDWATGRWFASAVAFSVTTTTVSSQVFLAVSQTFDPHGDWLLYQVAPTLNVLADQPSLGLSSDKVVISWNDFKPNPATFGGEETWVLQKSDALGGQALQETAFGPDLYRFSLIGAAQESPTNTAFLAYNGSHARTPFIGVVGITGTPAQHSVAWNERDLPIVATSQPPPAQQPLSPGTTTAVPIATNDDRFTSVVWSNGILWAAGNDGCTPAGDTAVRACLKLVEVATTWMVVKQDMDLGVAGASVYFPAVAMDPSTNMVVGFTRSSPTQFASVEATGELASDATALFAETTVMAGQGVYHCSNNCAQGANDDRWGDYAAAAPEPCGSASVWVAAEYAGDGSDPTDWGTAAGKVQVTGSQGPPFQACPWEEHGGVLAGNPAATRGDMGRLDVFLTGTDGVLYHRFVDNFNPWQWDPYLPPLQVTSDPSSVSGPSGALDVFVRGADGALWRACYRANTFCGSWQPLGGAIASGTAPSVVALGSGNLDVFVEGPDKQLWEDRYTQISDSWAWSPRGGILASSPSGVSAGPGTAAAMVEGADGSLWGWSSSSASWTGYGGRLANQPAAISSAPGTTDAFVEGSDRVLYHWSSAIPSNGGWETVGGQLAGSVGAVSWGSGRVDLFVQGTDFALWHAWTASGQAPWSWEGDGGKITGSPAPTTSGPNTLDVFVRGGDNGLWNLPFG